jgi:hypothetical protein
MNNTGGPAFPHHVVCDKGWSETKELQGMTLRDYFAAQALTGAQVWDAVLNGKNAVLAGGGVGALAEIAYAVADAMLKAREQ